MRKKFFILTGFILASMIACSNSDAAINNMPDEIKSPPAPTRVKENLKTENELSATASADRGKLIEVKMLDGNENYVYEPADLLFSVGEKITFKIYSETEFHTFTIDELDIYETADAGESYEFTVTFETPGTYKLYCVPHETLGMIGEVTVQ